jgi:hypothetical protein
MSTETSSVLALARPDILELQPYQHASWDPSLERMHANEMPWRAQGDNTVAGLNRYPEPQPRADPDRARHKALARSVRADGGGRVVDTHVPCDSRRFGLVIDRFADDLAGRIDHASDQTKHVYSQVKVK